MGKRARSALCVLVLFVSSAVEVRAGQAAQLRVVAVAVNDVSMEPSDEVVAAPGDTITVDVLASDWSAAGQMLHGYQLWFDAGGYATGSSGIVLPLGWTAGDSCATRADCDEFDVTFRTCLNGRCVYNVDDEASAFVDRFREDYVYFGRTDVTVFADHTAPDIRIGVLAQKAPFPAYSMPEDYLGSARFRVSEDACGTFALRLIDDLEYTHLLDEAFAFMGDGLSGGVTVHVPADCSCAELIATVPPMFARDARQPFDPDGGNVQGWRRMTFSFVKPVCVGLGPADFVVRTEPEGSTPIVEKVVSDGTDVHVDLDQPVPVGVWTCVRFERTGDEVCVIHSPGDVNGDGVSGPGDILTLIDHLNGVVQPALSIWHCDIDQSGQCGPPDILRIIDLLNGAGAYEPYLNVVWPNVP
jgi:hypothetical protein